MSLNKGALSRQWIVDHSISVYNTYGLDITLTELADYLQVSRGRITHFFATRESLFVAIGTSYQEKLQEIRIEFVREFQEFDFDNLPVLFSRIMDNQYAYRCAILYSAGSGNSRKEMVQHLIDTYRKSKQNIRVMVETLVQKGSLSHSILDYANYITFEFQFVNLFTTWVISQEIYYPNRPYHEMKPLYLEGLFRLFDPFLSTNSTK